MTVWSLVKTAIILWLLRKAVKLLGWLMLTAAVIAAWPLTLVAAAGFTAAWLRGWPPARLRRAARLDPSCHRGMAGRPGAALARLAAGRPGRRPRLGRQRTRNGRRLTVPETEWLWSPQPVHPAIVDRATWDAAQVIGAEHGTSRDGYGQSRHPAAARAYVYRSRVRCKTCKRRMGSQAYRTGLVYYQCPHDPGNPRHAASHPDHPRTVKASETRLDEITGLFFARHVFGPGRAALLP